MASKAPETVRIECIVNPDVHTGDGRVLKGPERSGTRIVRRGDVADVTPEIAEILIGNGQCVRTDSDTTVGEAE